MNTEKSKKKKVMKYFTCQSEGLTPLQFAQCPQYTSCYGGFSLL